MSSLSPFISAAALNQLLSEATAAAQVRVQARQADLARGYIPYGGAAQLRGLVEAGESEILICGPAGTGKSRAVLELFNALAWEFPRSRWLFVRETRVSLTESALVTFEDKVLLPGSPILDGPGRLNRHSYVYPTGSEIVIGGLDKPGKLFSTEFDGIYVQEAVETRLNKYESLLRCLRNGRAPWQFLLADTNPGPPQHWLKQRADAGVIRMVHSRHEDNPLLWDRAKGDWTPFGRLYIQKLDRMTGARKARLRHGLWAQAEGVVYEDFDAGLHIIPRFDIPATWRRVRVVDFGYTNPFCCQWWAIDPDGRAYRYREIYYTGRIVADHAEDIKRLSAGETIEATICDHDAEDAATLERSGIRTQPADKVISPGIQKVQQRLRRAGDGRPRLFLLEGSLVERDPVLVEEMYPCCTEEEFPAYVWATSPDGRPNKELPLDLHNHGCDGARYLANYLDAPRDPVPTTFGVAAKPAGAKRVVTDRKDSFGYPLGAAVKRKGRR